MNLINAHAAIEAIPVSNILLLWDDIYLYVAILLRQFASESVGVRQIPSDSVGVRRSSSDSVDLYDNPTKVCYGKLCRSSKIENIRPNILNKVRLKSDGLRKRKSCKIRIFCDYRKSMLTATK